MTDVPAAPDWWQASDGKWYPPEQHPDNLPPGGQVFPPGGEAFPPGGQVYPTSGYGSPYGGMPVAPKNEPMAIVSLCLGIGGLVFGLLCCIGLIATIAAIVLGVMAKKKIAVSGGALTGAGMAQAGFIIGIVGTVVIIAENIAIFAVNTGN